MLCNICQNKTHEIFKANVLKKYSIKYFQCEECNFIQTENPFWLEEAYSNAISALDTGYVTRNLFLHEITGTIINYFFNNKRKFLDYGGGYGLFVRLMRDKGYDFYWDDKYCTNIFANTFNYKSDSTNIELLTAFEVFEHLPNPMDEIKKMLLFSNSILFTTELQPNKKISKQEDWWYFVPESGQHISFYSIKSLNQIAKILSLNLYSNNSNLHLLTKQILSNRLFKNIILYHHFKNKFLKRHFFNKKSFIKSDFELVKNNIPF